MRKSHNDGSCCACRCDPHFSQWQSYEFLIEILKDLYKKKPASWSVVNSFHRKFIWTTVKFRVDKISFSIQPHMFLFPHYDNRNVIPILLFFDFFSAPFRDIIAWHNWTKVYLNAFTKDLNYMYMFFLCTKQLDKRR